MKSFIVFAALSIGVTFLSSCHKNTPKYTSPTPTTPAAVATGMYVLSTDDIRSMTTLAYYNFASKTLGPDLLGAIGGPGVGYGVVDMIVYGTKIYLADNGVNYRRVCTPTIDVLDAGTGRLLAQIPYTLKRPGSGSASTGQVARLTKFNGSVFVGNSNGTIAEVDTSALTIKRYARVGDFAVGGIAGANGQLFCALEDVESDSVAVLDLATWSLKGRIKVMDEPANMVADPFGNIYAISIDDDDAFNIPHVNPDTLGLPSNPSYGGFAVINSATDLVTSETQTRIVFSPWAAFFQDSLYYLTDNAVHVFNTRTQTLVNPNLVTVGSPNDVLTHLNVNPATAEVLVAICGLKLSGGQYIFNPATVNVYDTHGKMEYSFQSNLPTVLQTAFL